MFYERFEDEMQIFLVDGDQRHLHGVLINACPRIEEDEESWQKMCQELEDLIFVFRDGHGNEKIPSVYRAEQKQFANAEGLAKPYDREDPDTFHYQNVKEPITVEEAEEAIKNGARIVFCGFIP